ncbi:hypothetical protein [Streptomyces sp. DSM 41931]|uniref:hypothetical protein n=1 Tax=Streptomyces sp. DSM 41931 TaxID=3418367 RepID=UPI003CFF6F59
MSQKQCVSSSLMRGDVRDALAQQPVGQCTGKAASVRPDSVDLDLVRDLLRTAVAASDPVYWR